MCISGQFFPMWQLVAGLIIACVINLILIFGLKVNPMLAVIIGVIGLVVIVTILGAAAAPAAYSPGCLHGREKVPGAMHDLLQEGPEKAQPD